jgi:hypothetical protein
MRHLLTFFLARNIPPGLDWRRKWLLEAERGGWWWALAQKEDMFPNTVLI